MLKLIRNLSAFSFVLNKLKVCIHGGSESREKPQEAKHTEQNKRSHFENFSLETGISLKISEKLNFSPKKITFEK